MEIIKNISTIVGCITASITLITLMARPFIKEFKNIKGTLDDKFNDIRSDINELDNKINDSKKQSQSINEKFLDIDHRFSRLESLVLENEADRIRTELFDCGGRCRRGIRLHPEEYDHIRSIYYKYSSVLQKNHEGTLEFDFITNYYNSQNFPEYHEHN